MYVKVSGRKISRGREGERKQRKGEEGKDMTERKRERRRREKVSLASKLAAAGKKEA